MYKLACVLIALVVAEGLQTAAGQQNTAQGEKLLAAAQHKATVDGDLKGAIEDYRRIVEGAGANRALAAQALVQMAECYQKLGDTESSRIYERVVRDYADQAEPASVARARLARTRPAAGASTAAARQVWTGPKVEFTTGSVSPDGRFVAFVDWDIGNLMLHDLAAGTDRQLTDRRVAAPWENAESPVVSNDGRLVAYAWRDKSSHRDLRVVGTGDPAGAPRRLYADDTIEQILPYAWAPDDRTIAVQVAKTDGSSHIGLVSAGDGTLRLLKPVERRGSKRLCFSPDGRHLAYDLPSSGKSDERDVFVLALDGAGEWPAVVYPGNDQAIGWSPDGMYLLFASDRGGAQGLWALAWDQKKPQGQPVLLRPDVNLAEPLGVTRAGALYYGVTLSERDVYVGAIDFSSGAILSPPTRLATRSFGANAAPDWSPDGKSLAYISKGAVLAIRSMDTGETRELRPALSRFFSPRWAPDGRSFAVDSRDESGRRGVYRVDAQTGAVSPIVQIPRLNFLYGLAWLPDGNRLVYRETEPPSAAVVVEYDIASGTRRELSREKVTTMSLSPDGRQLAYVASQQLLVLPVAGGPPREVSLPGIQGPIMVLAWTPDSRAVMIRVSSETPNGVPNFWLVSAVGGQPRKVDLKLRDTAVPPRFNPRTGQFAIAVDESRREVWVLERFLSAGKAPAPGRQLARRPLGFVSPASPAVICGRRGIRLASNSAIARSTWMRDAGRGRVERDARGQSVCVGDCAATSRVAPPCSAAPDCSTACR